MTLGRFGERMPALHISLSQPYLPDSMSSQHPGETFNSIQFILLDPAIGGASPGSGVATPAL